MEGLIVKVMGSVAQSIITLSTAQLLMVRALHTALTVSPSEPSVTLFILGRMHALLIIYLRNPPYGIWYS
jgi:hypothetical protein